MRIAVFSPKAKAGGVSGAAELSRRLTSLVSEDGLRNVEVRWAEQVDALREAAEGAECLLVLLGESPSASPKWLRDLTHSPPVVVVAPDAAAAALSLLPIRVEKIVEVQHLEKELATALQGALRSSHLGRVRSVLANVDGPSDMLRRWLLDVTEAFPPYTSVEQSVNGMPGAASTLRRHWRERIRRSRPLTFLRWILLARAVHARLSAPSWKQVAKSLGVSVKRLQRAAGELTGVPLAELVASSGVCFDRAFEAFVKRTFLERQA